MIRGRSEYGQRKIGQRKSRDQLDKDRSMVGVRRSLSGQRKIQVHLDQRCTTFLGQGIIFSTLEGQRQNYELNFPESSVKNRFFY